jgi:hypothetical protein
MQQMSLEAEALARDVMSATRGGIFRRHAIFKPYAVASSIELGSLEAETGVFLPADFRKWLLALGYGDLDEELSFRKEWLAVIPSGQLKGGVRFAQDVLGNFYAFGSGGRVFFLSRSEHVFAVMSQGFLEFVQELIRRDYKLLNWVNTLESQVYDW